MTVVLDVAGLSVSFSDGTQAVRGISFSIERGQTHCIVGESGCGKSVTSLAIMDLLARGARKSADHIRFCGEDISKLSERQMRRLRGDKIAMIFQEPMTSLNPAYTIGSQMTEVFRRHRGASHAEAMQRAGALLARVGIAAPELRLGQYPHELSGGLRQRVMIAMALMCDPQLLIADEPTTALDVTVQAQILSLLLSLQKESGLAILLITHDLGVVAHMADRVSVMYAGQIAESASTATLFSRPLHPYSRGLLDCVPARGRRVGRDPLATIPGVVPRMTAKSRGCGFRERCGFAMADCAASVPLRQADEDHRFLCHLTADRQDPCTI